MSNPGVIILSSGNIKKSANFRVEDNIGECMHIHYGEFRFDFSIEQFLKLEETVKEAFSSLLSDKDFNLEDYDPNFLATIGHTLKDLKEVKYETIKLNKLKVYNNKGRIPRIVDLNESMMYQALKGNTEQYKNYSQINKFGEENEERLNRLVEHVTKDKIQPIILFNDQNIIRDGQHRASIYLDLDKTEIPVIRLYFKKDRHSLSTTPTLDYFTKWDIERLKGIYRKARSTYRSLKERISLKLRRIRTK
jgi:hypothetical protein